MVSFYGVGSSGLNRGVQVSLYRVASEEPVPQRSALEPRKHALCGRMPFYGEPQRGRLASRLGWKKGFSSLAHRRPMVSLYGVGSRDRPGE